jgi:hypothetical protein
MTTVTVGGDNGSVVERTLVHGVCGYILYRVDSGDVLKRFADEVAPAVRSAVVKTGQGTERRSRCQSEMKGGADDRTGDRVRC